MIHLYWNTDSDRQEVKSRFVVSKNQQVGIWLFGPFSNAPAKLLGLHRETGSRIHALGHRFTGSARCMDARAGLFDFTWSKQISRRILACDRAIQWALLQEHRPEVLREDAVQSPFCCAVLGAQRREGNSAFLSWSRSHFRRSGVPSDDRRIRIRNAGMSRPRIHLRLKENFP